MRTLIGILFLLFAIALALGACGAECRRATDCQARCEMTRYDAVGQASGRCRTRP
jgi:hypothetical protein